MREKRDGDDSYEEYEYEEYDEEYDDEYDDDYDDDIDGSGSGSGDDDSSLYDDFGDQDDEEEECPEEDSVLEVNRECLEEDGDGRLNDKKGLILGWGKNDDDKKSDDLREVKLTVISNSKCMKAFR